MTACDSSNEDTARWQKSFASKANNRAWALAEQQSRTPDDSSPNSIGAHRLAHPNLKPSMPIDTLESLRDLYAQPQPHAVRKEIPTLDRHCRDFIALSPFLILSTSDGDHNLDASPRGGDPGFVKVTEDGHLLIPDAPGNNRLDSFENIVATGKVGRERHRGVPALRESVPALEALAGIIACRSLGATERGPDDQRPDGPGRCGGDEGRHGTPLSTGSLT